MENFKAVGSAFKLSMGSSRRIISSVDLSALRSKIKNNLSISGDNRLYVILHADGSGNFTVIENGVDKILSPEQLGDYFSGNKNATNGIVLVSCNDLDAAKAFSKSANVPVFSTNGAMTVHNNGIKLDANTDWYEVQPNGNQAVTASPINKCNPCTGAGTKLGVDDLLNNLKNVELSIRNAPNETIIIFNKNGDELGRSVGNASGVHPPIGVNLSETILTHNHPNTSWAAIKVADPTFTGTSFSVDDIRRLEVDELFEMRAVPKLSNDIIYSLKKSDGTNFDEDDVEAIIFELNKIWINKSSNLDAIYQMRFNALAPTEQAQILANGKYMQWSIISPEMFDMAKVALAQNKIIYQVIR